MAGYCPRYKCFVDAAVFSTTDFIGCGAVVEDLEGAFLGGYSGFQEGSANPTIAEAIALRNRLVFLQNRFPLAGCIYSDCQPLVNIVYSSCLDNSELCLVVLDWRSILHSRLDIHVKWIRRHSNVEAHALEQASICFAC
ncbi:hypothetical protein JCGZ_05814 [Jatropha curcas]|uniref:RNase H type-1 domain-containing protein n=1 Tax=Jatropha curcas TaxID=180498 RepID=A0A067JJ83_JATCU|nr:hypothetical protein JCGZ_05814 [Jatropha curcas]